MARMGNSRKLKIKKRHVVEHVPLPDGSISWADVIRVRLQTPDADFCRCEPELGEHLSTRVEGGATIHFVPSVNGAPVHVLAINGE